MILGENSDENIETREEEERPRTSEMSEGVTKEGDGKDIPESVNERSIVSQENSLPTENNSKSRNRSEDERRLKNIFARPHYAEPRHPIFSSPFCRHISPLAFGPKKPKWYQSLSTDKLYIFKDIINYVVVGRSGYFRFDDFLKSLQDFDPTITRSEVVEILQGMETSEFEELDFGKFLFLLAYKNQAENYPGNIEKSLSATPITPRQSLILSAISYYVLISSPEDIERYYIQNTRRKATVLHHHMETTRLEGLTERQMEIKQRNASKNLGLLYFLTGFPYALPVPFVPRFTKGKLYKEWKGSKYSTKPGDKFPEKSQYQPTVPIKEKRRLGERFKYRTEREKTVSAMTYGRIPLPQMRFPSKILNQLKAGGYTVELKDYIMEKAKEADQEFRKRLKEAAVLCAQHNLKPILRQGFPTTIGRDNFMECYKRYFPLKVSEVENYSLWVKPVGYRASNAGRPLYPDRIAFGRKAQ